MAGKLWPPPKFDFPATPLVRKSSTPNVPTKANFVWSPEYKIGFWWHFPPVKKYVLIYHRAIEEKILPDEKPEEHVIRLSREKALCGLKKIKASSERTNDVFPFQSENYRLVLGADTIVVIDGMILGKPVDTDDAQRMLGMLSGRIHTVYTGLTLLGENNATQDSRTEKTDVELRNLTPEEIRCYISTGEPMDKAGAYAVQGIGAGIVRRVNGCFYNVVGLPISLFLDMLNDSGTSFFRSALFESNHMRT